MKAMRGSETAQVRKLFAQTHLSRQIRVAIASAVPRGVGRFSSVLDRFFGSKLPVTVGANKYAINNGKALGNRLSGEADAEGDGEPDHGSVHEKAE